MRTSKIKGNSFVYRFYWCLYDLFDTVYYVIVRICHAITFLLNVAIGLKQEGLTRDSSMWTYTERDLTNRYVLIDYMPLSRAEFMLTILSPPIYLIGNVLSSISYLCRYFLSVEACYSNCVRYVKQVLFDYYLVKARSTWNYEGVIGSTFVTSTSKRNGAKQLGFLQKLTRLSFVVASPAICNDYADQHILPASLSGPTSMCHHLRPTYTAKNSAGFTTRPMCEPHRVKLFFTPRSLQMMTLCYHN